MKRFIFGIVLLTFVFVLISCNNGNLMTTEDYSVKLHSTHAFVYRYSDDSVRKMSADGSETVRPASITKLLTAITALEISSPDFMISPGDEVYLPAANSSSAYIRPHHTLTLEMLIEAMMLPSGNDAAYAAACGCGALLGGSGEEENLALFMAEMNKTAEKLGCCNSHFSVPDGYSDSGHYSSLDDMVRISLEAAANEIIMKYAGLYSDDVIYASGHTNTWINTNKLIDPSSVYFNEHVKGMKTGSLDGYYALITLYDDGENRYLIGVFGSDRENERFEDTLALIHAELASAKKHEN